MSDNVVHMKLEGSSKSHSRTDIITRDVESVIDEPIARGGTNLGLSPTETLVSSLIGCTNVITHRIMEKMGFKIDKLQSFEKYSVENIINSYYLRIMTEDKPGVLSSITNYFSDFDISVKKILQLPESSEADKPIPIIITTHNIQKEKLSNVINKIEGLAFVKEKITVLAIHDN